MVATREFNIRIEPRSPLLAAVELDGELVGYVAFDPELRAPKKWVAHLGPDGARGADRYLSMNQAAFALALDASDRKLADAIVAKLGVS